MNWHFEIYIKIVLYLVLYLDLDRRHYGYYLLFEISAYITVRSESASQIVNQD